MAIVIPNETISIIIIIIIMFIAYYVCTKANGCSERSRQIFFIAS